MSRRAPRVTRNQRRAAAVGKQWLKQSFLPPRKERRAWASIARSVAPSVANVARVTHAAPAEAVALREQLLSNADRRTGRHAPPLRELAESTEEVRAEHGLPYCGGRRFKRALAYTDALVAQGNDLEASSE